MLIVSDAEQLRICTIAVYWKGRRDRQHILNTIPYYLNIIEGFYKKNQFKIAMTYKLFIFLSLIVIFNFQLINHLQSQLIINDMKMTHIPRPWSDRINGDVTAKKFKKRCFHLTTFLIWRHNKQLRNLGCPVDALRSPDVCDWLRICATRQS